MSDSRISRNTNQRLARLKNCKSKLRLKNGGKMKHKILNTSEESVNSEASPKRQKYVLT